MKEQNRNLKQKSTRRRGVGSNCSLESRQLMWELEAAAKALVVLVLMVMRGRDRNSGRSLGRRREGVEPW